MPTVAETHPLAARWIVAELHATAARVNELLVNYRFDEAANAVYQFFWGSFCDWYIEIVKLVSTSEPSSSMRRPENCSGEYKRKRAALTTLVQVFEAALRLLSPFMPFLTEELWHAVYDGNPPAKSIALTKLPEADRSSSDTDSVIDMGFLQKLVTAIRANRKELNVEEKGVVDVEVNALGGFRKVVDRNLIIIQRLAKVNYVRHVNRLSEGLLKYSNPDFDVAVIYEKKIDVAAERERLTKEIEKREKQKASDELQLSDPVFLSKAPAHIVEGKKKLAAENVLLLEKDRAALAALPEE